MESTPDAPVSDQDVARALRDWENADDELRARAREAAARAMQRTISEPGTLSSKDHLVREDPEQRAENR